MDSELVKFHEHLGRHGATDEQVLNAHCKTKTPPDFTSISKYIYPKKQSKPIPAEIHGVQFENQSPEMIDVFNKLTTRRHHLNLTPWPSKQVPIQDDFQINPNCKKVICAVEKIWGQELGMKLLYMMNRHNFNGSDLAFIHSTPFTIEQMDEVLMALEDLPDKFIPLGLKNQQL